MRRIKRKAEAVILVFAMVIASIGLLPVSEVMAETKISLSGYDSDSEKEITGTFVADDTVEYSSIYENTLASTHAIENSVDKTEGSWTEAKEHMESGYTDLYMFAVWIQLEDTTSTPQSTYEGTLTMPIPGSFTKNDANDARIICLFDYSEEDYTVISPSSVTDTTVSFKVRLGGKNYASSDKQYIEMQAEIFVEFKKHAHTLPDKWESDDTNHWKTCTVCGEVSETSAHTFGGYESDETNHSHTCTVCGYKVTEAHTWDAGVVTAAATEEAEGVMTYTCTVCEKTKTEAIAKLPATQTNTTTEAATVAEGETLTYAAATYEVTAVKEDGTVEVAYTGTKKSKKKVTVPDTVTLEDGTVAEVTSIEANAFKNDKKLTTVTVGKNVETIGKNAFAGATKLKTVTLGKSVTSIGKGAFSGDKKLKTITIASKKLKTVGKNAFKGVTNATVKVPKASVKNTQSSSPSPVPQAA